MHALIEPSLRPSFAFCLSWGTFSREQAFEITVSAFTQTLRDFGGKKDGSEFTEALYRALRAECAKSPSAGSRGLAAFGTLPALQQPSLGIVREALMRLSRADRELLLLRDQCHLSFASIGAILGTGERPSRSACLAARERLRTQVEELLKDPGASHGL